MFALSTAYFTLGQSNLPGEALASKALELGFSALEVDYRVTAAQARGLRGPLGRGQIRVCSVHHPFPRPPDVDPVVAHTVGPVLTSLDPEERRSAIRQLLETLRRSEDFGSEIAVVVHLGAVALPDVPDPRRVETLLRRGDRDTEELRALVEQVSASRAAHAPPHLDAALLSLDPVVNEASKRGLWIGLENRYHADEMPEAGELDVIFRTLDGAPLGYWHDTGHGASLELQGFLSSQTVLLERFASRQLGLHIHDARGLEDHLAPGEGEIDFRSLAPHVSDRARLVLEVHPESPPRAVADAKHVLQAAGIPPASTNEDP